MAPASRAAAIEAGTLAGIAGLLVFLLLHHLWIVPIWFIAPVGAVLALGGGAALGAAYAEIRSRLPGRPWTTVGLVAVIVAVMAPAILVAELRGPIYAFGGGGEGRLLVAPLEAILMVGAGLLATSTLAGAVVGWLLGRTRRAAATMALAGFALGLGPGHNIPFLGGTPATPKELTIFAAVTLAGSLVLVASHRWLARRSPAHDTIDGHPAGRPSETSYDLTEPFS